MKTKCIIFVKKNKNDEKERENLTLGHSNNLCETDMKPNVVKFNQPGRFQITLIKWNVNFL